MRDPCKVVLSVLVLLSGPLLTNAMAVGWGQECIDHGCLVNPVALEGCLPDGSCQGFSNNAAIYDAGGDPSNISDCLGDGDGDGIDDACGCTELLTGCCHPDGCLERMVPADCEAIGGMPFGACSPCALINCPLPACIGATEPCGEIHGEPGCESPYCCSQICGNLPDCCEAAICGNGVIDAGEECDDGNEVDGDGCDSNCTVTGCGNGIMTEGEECDDGNNDDGDGCSADCTIEVAIPAASTRGAVLLALLLLAAATGVLIWRR